MTKSEPFRYGRTGLTPDGRAETPATWEASWIVHPEIPATDFSVRHFRRVFELESVSRVRRIRVSADPHRQS